MVFLLFARFKIVENNFALLKGFTINCYFVLPMNLESRRKKISSVFYRVPAGRGSCHQVMFTSSYLLESVDGAIVGTSDAYRLFFSTRVLTFSKRYNTCCTCVVPLPIWVLS